MYEIKYENHLIQLKTMEEVIQYITDLNNDGKQCEPQMLMIKLNNTRIELGLGDKQDRAVILFYAKNSAEDTMLSYNEGSSEGDITFYRKNNIPFECKEYNLIPLHIALAELGHMLSNDCLSATIRWYSL